MKTVIILGLTPRPFMEKHLPTLEAWDAQYLKENGEKKKLGT